MQDIHREGVSWFNKVIILAIDTTEQRGSVALISGRGPVALARHDGGEDYSSWLLPATERVLVATGISMGLIEVLAVATGPGSFTGLRVGLTTVKAWSEVYGKPVVGVSRLAAMAGLADGRAKLVAASYDAHRGQLFGAIYERSGDRLELVGDEMVIAPEQFVAMVDGEAGERAVTWICCDPELIESVGPAQQRLHRGHAADHLVVCPGELAPAIGRLAEERARNGQFSDPLGLDANYVRRSDAEIFWKDTPSRVR